MDISFPVKSRPIPSHGRVFLMAQISLKSTVINSGKVNRVKKRVQVFSEVEDCGSRPQRSMRDGGVAINKERKADIVISNGNKELIQQYSEVKLNQSCNIIPDHVALLSKQHVRMSKNRVKLNYHATDFQDQASFRESNNMKFFSQPIILHQDLTISHTYDNNSSLSQSNHNHNFPNMDYLNDLSDLTNPLQPSTPRPTPPSISPLPLPNPSLPSLATSEAISYLSTTTTHPPINPSNPSQMTLTYSVDSVSQMPGDVVGSSLSTPRTLESGGTTQMKQLLGTLGSPSLTGDCIRIEDYSPDGGDKVEEGSEERVVRIRELIGKKGDKGSNGESRPKMRNVFILNRHTKEMMAVNIVESENTDRTLSENIEPVEDDEEQQEDDDFEGNEENLKNAEGSQSQLSNNVMEIESMNDFLKIEEICLNSTGKKNSILNSNSIDQHCDDEITIRNHSQDLTLSAVSKEVNVSDLSILTDTDYCITKRSVENDERLPPIPQKQKKLAKKEEQLTPAESATHPDPDKQTDLTQPTEPTDPAPQLDPSEPTDLFNNYFDRQHSSQPMTPSQSADMERSEDRMSTGPVYSMKGYRDKLILGILGLPGK